MRICYQEMNPEPDCPVGLRSALEKLLREVARPGIEIEVRFPTKRLGDTGAASSEFNADYVACIQQAEEDGFDSVLVGGFYIPSVYEAKRVCDIPVLSPGESAMLCAHLMGAKYAIVAYPGPLIGHLIESQIDQYGLRGKAIVNPVRFMAFPERDLWRIGDGMDPTPMVESFLQVSRGAVQEGAEVIIPGCTCTSLIHDQLSQAVETEIGVPVLSPVQAELKLAELLIDFKRKMGFHISRAGAFFRNSD